MNIFGTKFDYKGRLEKVRKLMDERDIDCLFVHNWVNQYYISGVYQHLPWYPVYHGSDGELPVILFRDRTMEPVYLTGYITHNPVKAGTWIEDVRIWHRSSPISVHEFIAEVLKEKGLDKGKIGIEEDCCTASTFTNLQKAIPKAQFKHASNVFKLARVVKEPEEIELIKKAVSIGESALKVAMDVAKPGVAEMEVQRAMEMEMKRLGGFREVETMVQSGIRTADYRAFGTEWKKIGENELVMADLGCVYKGYGCDITRTWVVGTATKEQKKIAQDLYKIQEKILAFIKPGLKYYEVSDFARKELAGAGYPGNEHAFPCNLFSLHGLGLGPFHDPPDREFKDIVLESGMVLSVQPSVLQKTFTIRFEDDAVLRPEGLELMTKLPRELI